MKQNNDLGIDAYLALIETYPHLTEGLDTPLKIITDKTVLQREQETLYKMADETQKPRVWFDLGIVAQDQWVVVLRDLVQFPNGSYGGYIRTLNRTSQIEKSGKDVVVLVSIDDRVLLMKHFRHDNRQWNWECPRGFGEPNLSPMENAEKEVKEETGLTVLELRQLNCDTESVLYFETKCAGKPEKEDLLEAIDGYMFADQNQVNQMLRDGLICDPYTIRAIMLSRVSL